MDQVRDVRREALTQSMEQRPELASSPWPEDRQELSDIAARIEASMRLEIGVEVVGRQASEGSSQEGSFWVPARSFVGS